MNNRLHRIETMMKNKGEESVSWLAALLSMVSLGYRGGLWCRDFCFKTGLKRSKRLPCKIISIGNITVGGTGKTPMSMFVAEAVKKMGRKPAILIRGYRGRAEKKGGIVSDGKTLLMGSEEAGDEAFLMASLMKGVPVLVGRDRYASGQTAIQAFGSEVLVLDDAFQHRGLMRDVDLVLLDEQQPFGNQKLLPRGRLREPIHELRRGDAVILTRSRGYGDETASMVKKIKPDMPVFRSFHRPVVRTVIRKTSGDASEPKIKDNDRATLLKGKTVFAFSGIAANQEFQDTIGALGGRLVGALSFADHHKYTEKDIQTICRQSNQARADILATTEKDFARFGHQVPQWPMDLLVIGIDISFDPDAHGFITFLKSRLEGET